MTSMMMMSRPAEEGEQNIGDMVVYLLQVTVLLDAWDDAAWKHRPPRGESMKTPDALLVDMGIDPERVVMADIFNVRRIWDALYHGFPRLGKYVPYEEILHNSFWTQTLLVWPKHARSLTVLLLVMRRAVQDMEQLMFKQLLKSRSDDWCEKKIHARVCDYLAMLRINGEHIEDTRTERVVMASNITDMQYLLHWHCLWLHPIVKTPTKRLILPKDEEFDEIYEFNYCEEDAQGEDDLWRREEMRFDIEGGTLYVSLNDRRRLMLTCNLDATEICIHHHHPGALLSRGFREALAAVLGTISGGRLALDRSWNVWNRRAYLGKVGASGALTTLSGIKYALLKTPDDQRPASLIRRLAQDPSSA